MRPLVSNSQYPPVEVSRIRTTPAGIKKYFASKQASLVTLEVVTHSPWFGHELVGVGHKVIVANARKVRLIHGGGRKNDKLDAEKLARLTRVDAKLLSPIKHRNAKAQADLARIGSRDALVAARTALIMHVRGSVKSFGARLPSGSTEVFAGKAREHLTSELRPALEPVLTNIEELTASIKLINEVLTALAADYPSTNVLRQVGGVGLLTSLAFQLIIEVPCHFAKSREISPYLASPQVSISQATATPSAARPRKATLSSGVS